MLIVLISLLTLALLVALVLGLHRYQLSVAQSNADKHDPLPPLDSTALNSSLPDFELDEDLGAETPLQIRAAAEAPPGQGDSSSLPNSTAGNQEQPGNAFHDQVKDEESGEPFVGFPQQDAETETGQPKADPLNHHNGQTSGLSSSHETTQIELPEPGSEAGEPTGENDDDVTLISSPEFKSNSDAPVAPPSGRETPDPVPSLRPPPGTPGHQAHELPATSSENSFAVDAGVQTAEWATESATPFPSTADSQAPAAAKPPASNRENTGVNLPGKQVEALSSLLHQGDTGQNQYGSTLDSENDAAGAAESESSLSDADNWQEQVQELKKQDHLDDALKLCQEQLPLWSAYQQASLIHRARLKQLSQEDRDIEGELKALYDIAAKASFLHDRVKGLPNLPLSQLKKVDLDEVESLEMPYEQIGYNELRLIKKTDIKLLLEKWGKPQAHIKPRELHAETWKSLIARRQTTLF